MGGQFNQRANRHAVAAPFGDFGGIQRVAAPVRVPHHHRLHGARFQHLLQGIAFFKRNLRHIHAMPRAGAQPALLRQNQRNRLVGGGLRERGAFGGGNQRAAGIAKLLGIGLDFFDDELALFVFVAQQRFQAACFFAQLVEFAFNFNAF